MKLGGLIYKTAVIGCKKQEADWMVVPVVVRQSAAIFFFQKRNSKQYGQRRIQRCYSPMLP